MTASRAIFLVFFICVIAFVIWRKKRARGVQHPAPEKGHAPHKPGPDYNPTEVARMEMESRNSGGPAHMHSQRLP